MDHLHDRIDALEQQVQTLTQHAHTATRKLRWWRGLAGGLLVLAVLTWALPVVTADDAKHDDKKGLEQRVAALEQLLKHFSRKGNEVFITGANLHIVNGLGSTDCTDEGGNEIPDCPNGLGNLIVGYNEPREDEENIRTGSHNGGLVVGDLNTISGDFAVVSGGHDNTASGDTASVSGGTLNTASGDTAAVSGGAVNTASGSFAVVSGGAENTASGNFAVVSGGTNNTASGERSSVSGGRNITQETEFGWAAGSEGDEVFVGNFRSP